jgi:hypothetical protein
MSAVVFAQSDVKAIRSAEALAKADRIGGVCARHGHHVSYEGKEFN